MVSLNTFGKDFNGGLYVSTGNSNNESKFVALQSGDAIFHQSDLLHGVRVTGGERWSWILWFYDGGKECQTNPADWFREEAEEGDALAQFLLSKRVHMQTYPNGDRTQHEQKVSEMRRWLGKSAEGGFALAQNDLAELLKVDAKEAQAEEEEMERMRRQFSIKGMDKAQKPVLKSTLLRKQALELYQLASAYEGDAMYNIGLLHLEEATDPSKRGPGATSETQFKRAIDAFEKAAKMGSRFAMFNLGHANSNGAADAGREKNLSAALQWFLCAETAKGMRYAADTLSNPELGKMFNITAAQGLYLRSARMGDPIARSQVIRDYGSKALRQLL